MKIKCKASFYWVATLLLAIQFFNVSTSYGQLYRNEDYFAASLHSGINALARRKNPNAIPASVGLNINSNFSYKVSYFWGVRADLNFNMMNSSVKPNVKVMQFGIGAYADLLQIGTEGYVERMGDFSLYGYSTFGLATSWQDRKSSGDTKYLNGNDDMLYWNIGFTPRYRLTEIITINCDLVYNLVLNQDQYFDGSGKTIKRNMAGWWFAFSLDVTDEIK